MRFKTRLLPPLFALVALLSFRPAAAQSSTYSIKGVIVDSAGAAPLVMATVYVKDMRDSLLLGYALTDAKGNFLVKDIPRDSTVRFRIFYTGYARYTRVLKDVSPQVLDMGKIPLAMNSHELGTLTVTGEKPPIAIKGDTIEFNASSFKTRPNSVLSDLLKKLPGVDVDENGQVTAGGKPVDKIMLDGKAFFGNDPKIAMQNLPSAIVDKVQITDTKTTEQEMTGDPASGDSKTINITLKKGLDHGYFGRAYAGYGTGKHYDASALVNYFRGKERISLLGATNNINQVGFSPNEAADMMGSSSRVFVNSGTGNMYVSGMSFGGNSGLNKNALAGLNYGNDLGKHLSATGSYFYGDADNRSDVKTSRQNILPDSIFYYDADNRSTTSSHYHRINLTFDYKDSLWRINYQPYLGLSDEQGLSESTASSTGAKGDPVNQSDSRYTTHETTFHLRNNLSVYRTFKQKKQLLALYLYADNTDVRDHNYNQFHNLFFDGSTPADSANQAIGLQSGRDNYQGHVEYRQPLTPSLSLAAGYEFRMQSGLTDKKTFDYDPASGKYMVFDSAYSNKFKSTMTMQMPFGGLVLDADSGKWYLSATAHLYFIRLHHYSYIQDVSFSQHQFYVIPQVQLRRQIKPQQYLSAVYYSYVDQPSIEQLLPITDNTNPLYERRGNPDLRPSLIQGASLGYDFNNIQSGTAMWLGATYTITRDGIATVSSYDEQLRQLTTYANVQNNNSWRAYFSISKEKKQKNQHWHLSMDLDAGLNKNHAFINTLPYVSRNYTVEARPSVTYGYKDLLEVNPSLRFNYTFNRYDLESLVDRQNTMYTAGFSGTLYWPSPFTWTSDLDYTHNSDVVPGFSRGYWLWNVSVGADFLKGKRANLQFSVYDLLNQNQAVRRQITDTYVEDTRTVMLQRYFMLKLTYNIRKQTGRKQKNDRVIIF